MAVEAEDLAARLKAEFPHALRTGQLVAYYQPEIELSSGRVLAALRGHRAGGRSRPRLTRDPVQRPVRPPRYLRHGQKDRYRTDGHGGLTSGDGLA